MQHLLHAPYRATEQCTSCIAVFLMTDLLFATIGLKYYSDSLPNFRIPEVFNPKFRTESSTRWFQKQFYCSTISCKMTRYRTLKARVPLISIIFLCHHCRVSSISNYHFSCMFVINQFYTLPLFGFELAVFRYWWYTDLYALLLGHPCAWYYCSYTWDLFEKWK